MGICWELRVCCVVFQGGGGGAQISKPALLKIREHQ